MQVEFTLNNIGRLNFFDMNLIDSYNLSMTIELWARTGLKNYTAMGAKRATIIGNASLTWFGFKLSEGQTYYYEYL